MDGEPYVVDGQGFHKEADYVVCSKDCVVCSKRVRASPKGLILWCVVKSLSRNEV